jgi:DNA-binding transcriptional ArsR family regulator
LLQAVGGHRGLANGRVTLAVQGWPNLQKAQRALEATGYSALQRGRSTQASQGGPGLMAGQACQAASGYAPLAKGRANLAARDWPNWTKAHDILAAQEYFPLLEAQRRRPHETPLPATDRRVMRGRNTRLAIIEALHVLQTVQVSPGGVEACTHTLQSPKQQVTGRQLADYLRLHPRTVYAHLKQLRATGLI